MQTSRYRSLTLRVNQMSRNADAAGMMEGGDEEMGGGGEDMTAAVL